MAKTINEDLTPLLSGVAGEYFVAGELSRRGFIASITLKNSRGIDVLVSNEAATKTIGVQVKTNKNNQTQWMLRDKAENYVAENLFYVFVNLRDKHSRPDFYIVPSKEVAKHVKASHRKWLETPGKRGQKHNDNSIRWFEDYGNKYLEKWELLGL